jgi:hypothetical protein
MPYQVKSGSLTIVAATLVAALAVLDDMTRTAADEVLICDMDGHRIDPALLRSAIADANDRR